MLLKCKYCNIVFNSKNKKQIYCSKECRRSEEMKIRREKRKEKLLSSTTYCWYCGKDFSPTKFKQNFCSTRCRNTYKKRQVYKYHKEYYKNKDMTKYFNRTKVFWTKANKITKSSANNERKNFTDDEIKILLSKKPLFEIALELGRSYSSVSSARHRYKKRKK